MISREVTSDSISSEKVRAMEQMKRRDFVQRISMGAGAMAMSAQAARAAGVSGGLKPVSKNNPTANTSRLVRLHELQKPVAIAMWDFSWILRHHLLGSFEDWDLVLDQLVERGYNAVRVDAMPQFVAADTDGTVQEEFFCAKDGWRPACWGNDVSVYIRPRDALLEFLPKCSERGIHVGLASWFLSHGTPRKDIFQEEGGLLRAWIETLTFLDNHSLLDSVLYVDVLNEYPFWHGYQWLQNELNERSDLNKFKEENPDAHIPDFDPSRPREGMNPVQRELYNQFVTATLNELKKKWGDLPFYVSLDSEMQLPNIDLSAFDGLDYHIWFVHNPSWSDTRYRDIHGLNNEQKFYEIYDDMMRFWRERRKEMIGWMEERITTISQTAKQHGIPCGNTEGWGSIIWIDHPALGWEWVKESGDICSELALQHGYKFICTSNFTHPQFKGMWEDIAWHRRITDRIKKG
ncbi:MAG: cellulase-like family protein [bacterium]